MSSSPTYGAFRDRLAASSLSRECQEAIESVKAKPVADRSGQLQTPGGLAIKKGARLDDERARALHGKCSGSLENDRGRCQCRHHDR